MAPDIIDVDEIIKAWAREYPLESDQRAKIAKDFQASDINWKHFKLTHQKPKYKHEKQVMQPKTHILFTSIFTNDTGEIQSYNFKAERRTKSSCTVSVIKGFRFAAHVDVKLVPPNPVIQANAGFKSELSLTKFEGQTFDEELVWTVDSNVKVPARKRTLADLVIREDNYKGEFSVRSKFEGKIHISLRHKKDNSIVTTITGKCQEIFTPEKGFQVDKTGIYYVTKGVCQCQFGVEQHVRLRQHSLADKLKAGCAANGPSGEGGNEGEGGGDGGDACGEDENEEGSESDGEEESGDDDDEE